MTMPFYFGVYAGDPPSPPDPPPPGTDPGYSDSVQILEWDPFLAPGRKGSIRPDLTNGCSAWYRPRAIDSEIAWKVFGKPITRVVINNNSFSHAMRQFAPVGSPVKILGWNGRGAGYNTNFQLNIANGTTGHPDPTETNPSRDSSVSLLWWSSDLGQWVESQFFAFENIGAANNYRCQVHYTNYPNPENNPAPGGTYNPRYTPQIGWNEQGHFHEGGDATPYSNDVSPTTGLPKYFNSASNTANWASYLSKFELETPGFPIRHALAIAQASNSTTPGWVWPAASSDGSSTNPNAVPEGTLYAIPSSVDLNSLGLSEIGLRLGRAMQRYGIYVVDVAPNHPTQGATQTSIALSIERECAASTKAAIDADMLKLFPTDPNAALIRIVSNNAEAQVASGGSTPVVPHSVNVFGTPGNGHLLSDGRTTWRGGANHHPPTAVMP